MNGSDGIENIVLHTERTDGTTDVCEERAHVFTNTETILLQQIALAEKSVVKRESSRNLGAAFEGLWKK